VCYNKSTDQQTFQQGTHTDDILCLTMHPDGNFCATGEVGDVPKIVVWDNSTMVTKAVLEGFHTRGVGLVKFNGAGNLLLSVGLDDLNSVAIYNWEQSRIIATAVVSSTKVMAACFVGDLILLGGQQMIKFFSLEGDSMICQNGVFGKNSVTTRENFFCMCAEPLLEDYSITTGLRGEVLVWKAHRCVAEKNCLRSGVFRHADCVSSLWTNPGKRRTKEGKDVAFCEVATGDRSGVIAIWEFLIDDRFEHGTQTRHGTRHGFLTLKKVFRLQDVVPTPLDDQSVRSLCLMNDDLLVGTAGSKILEISLDSSLDVDEFQGKLTWPSREKKCEVHVEVFNEGHFSGDVWGLATHPGKDLFCTGGDDRRIRLWKFGDRKCQASIVVDAKCRALAYQPCGVYNMDNPHLAIGMNQGHVLVVKGELQEGEPLAHLKDAKQWIQEMKYSFEGSRLVVGSHDCNIYIYDVENK
jgi:microtubule-associated protein-like 6